MNDASEPVCKHLTLKRTADPTGLRNKWVCTGCGEFYTITPWTITGAFGAPKLEEPMVPEMKCSDFLVIIKAKNAEIAELRAKLSDLEEIGKVADHANEVVRKMQEDIDAQTTEIAALKESLGWALEYMCLEWRTCNRHVDDFNKARALLASTPTKEPKS